MCLGEEVEICVIKLGCKFYDNRDGFINSGAERGGGFCGKVGSALVSYVGGSRG